MRWYYLILGSLGVWRVTHLLHAEDGPFDLFLKLRRSAGDSFFGKALDCFYCLSLWLSLPFALMVGETWLERALLWLALSAAAILLERLTAPAPTADYHFEPSIAEEPKHVLWQEPDDTRDHLPPSAHVS